MPSEAFANSKRDSKPAHHQFHQKQGHLKSFVGLSYETVQVFIKKKKSGEDQQGGQRGPKISASEAFFPRGNRRVFPGKTNQRRVFPRQPIRDRNLDILPWRNSR